MDAAPRRFGQIESGRAAEQLCDLLLVREIRSRRQITHRVIHRPPTDLGDESLGFCGLRRPHGALYHPCPEQAFRRWLRDPEKSGPVPGSLGTLAYLVPTSAGVKLSPGLPWSYRQRFATAIAQHLGELPYLRLSLGEVLTIWHVPVQGMDFRHAGRLLRPAWLRVTTRDKHYSLPSQSEMASRGAIRPDGLSCTSPRQRLFALWSYRCPPHTRAVCRTDRIDNAQPPEEE